MAGESQLPPRSEPDPTVATNDAVERAVGAERDYVNGLVAVINERLRGIDRATELLNETVNRVPTDVTKEVTHLRELNAVEFSSIALQFKERDTRSERESRDNKVAVDAAFAAQKEAAAKQDEGNQKAIDKSEKATNETIIKLAELVKTTTDSLGKENAETKDRVSRIESIKVGGQESKAALYAALFAIVAVLSIAAYFIGNQP